MLLSPLKLTVSSPAVLSSSCVLYVAATSPALALFSTNSLAATSMVGASLTSSTAGVALSVPVRLSGSVTVRATGGRLLPAFTCAAPFSVSTTWPSFSA
ncbi:hypothetical protein D1872_309790 [compost metagenome]